MKELQDILIPSKAQITQNNLGVTTIHQHADWEEADILFLGAECNEGDVTTDAVREILFSYHLSGKKPKIVDLGNLAYQTTCQDPYQAIRYVLTPYLKKGKTILFCGKKDDYALGLYFAFQDLEQWVSYVDVDCRFDIGAIDESPQKTGNYLQKIFNHQPNYLLNYCNLGFQSYLVPPEFPELFEGLNFETVRLGTLRGSVESAEPLVRNADLLTFDINAVKFSDAPAQNQQSPNGLYAEEACQIMKYAGFSDQMQIVGMHGLLPEHGREKPSAQLVAQMFWSFLEGYINRQNDYPKGSYLNYKKYYIAMDTLEEEIVFFHSPKTGRWWLKMPQRVSSKFKNTMHNLIPCSYDDYLAAKSNKVPDRWWKGIFR